MKIVQKGEFPGTRAELEAAVAAYRQALEDHKATVGKPAPWPAHEILRVLVRLPADQWALASEIDPDDPEAKPGEPRRLDVLEALLVEKGVFTQAEIKGKRDAIKARR